MDELLREFLTETAENLDHVDAQLVRFEREPNNGQVLSNIFRLVHTIKGTCGFLGLPRLEAPSRNLPISVSAACVSGGTPYRSYWPPLIASKQSSTGWRSCNANLPATTPT